MPFLLLSLRFPVFFRKIRPSLQVIVITSSQRNQSTTPARFSAMSATATPPRTTGTMTRVRDLVSLFLFARRLLCLPPVLIMVD